jgi:hypothetical protein
MRITRTDPLNYLASYHYRNCVLLFTAELPWYQNTIPMHLHQHLKKPIRLECTTSLGGDGKGRANTVSFYSGPFNKLKQPSTPSPLESSSNSVHFQNRVPPPLPVFHSWKLRRIANHCGKVKIKQFTHVKALLLNWCPTLISVETFYDFRKASGTNWGKDQLPTKNQELCGG